VNVRYNTDQGDASTQVDNTRKY